MVTAAAVLTYPRFRIHSGALVYEPMFVFIVRISIHPTSVVSRPNVKYCGEHETSLTRPIKNTYGGLRDKTGSVGKKVAWRTRPDEKGTRLENTKYSKKKRAVFYAGLGRYSGDYVYGEKNERVFVTYSRRPHSG